MISTPEAVAQLEVGQAPRKPPYILPPWQCASSAASGPGTRQFKKNSLSHLRAGHDGYGMS